MKNFWNNIQENYSLGFRFFLKNEECQFLNGNIFPQWDNDEEVCLYQIRNLYDFFDSVGIYGYCNPHKEQWVWGIELKGRSEDIIDTDYKYYKTRFEAEKPMFTKEFEILENKLKNK